MFVSKLNIYYTQKTVFDIDIAQNLTTHWAKL